MRLVCTMFYVVICLVQLCINLMSGKKMEVISEGQYITVNMSSYRNRRGLGMASVAHFPSSFSLYGDRSKI